MFALESIMEEEPQEEEPQEDDTQATQALDDDVEDEDDVEEEDEEDPTAKRQKTTGEAAKWRYWQFSDEHRRFPLVVQLLRYALGPKPYNEHKDLLACEPLPW